MHRPFPGLGLVSHSWRSSALPRTRALLILVSINAAIAAAEIEQQLSNTNTASLGLQRSDGVEATCRLESFYIVDANTMAKRANVPICNSDKMFSVSEKTGQIFLKGSKESQAHNASAMHFFGTYAAPWFLYQGIADSPYETRDSEHAGIFYVNDYCYYMWWLAAAQSKDAIQDSPGSYLIKIYEEVLKMHKWQRRNGTDFVFFFPWSISHVWEYEHARPDGGVIQAYLDIVCNELKTGMHVTVENMQGKNMCKHNSARKTMVAPFVPNVIDIKSKALVESLTSMERHVNGIENRSTLVHFKGRCSHHSQNPSRLLRSHVAAGMADGGPDVQVRCIEKEPTGRLPFERLLSEMEQSKFCLVLPESGQSARLLSEAMLAGCIPVFLGPPFAAMPFIDDLDYSAFSLILYLEDHKEWTENVHRSLQTEVASNSNNRNALKEDYVSTADDLKFDARLASVREVENYLRNISREDLLEGLAEVKRVRRSFLFYPELDHEHPSAVDLLTLNLCRHMNHLANSQPSTAASLRRFLRQVLPGNHQVKHLQKINSRWEPRLSKSRRAV